MWTDALSTADRVSAYFWSVSHVLGACVMGYGWRRYRQQFFMWMTCTWVLQIFGGVTRELFPPNAQMLIRVALRLGVTACSFAAFYYGVILVRRKSTLLIVGVEDDGRQLRVREGMEDRLLDVKPVEQAADASERPTLRPPA